MNTRIREAAASVAYDVAVRVCFWRKCWPFLVGSLFILYIAFRVSAVCGAWT